MGCKGGCVGGPRANIDVSKATELVNQYGMDAPYQSPVENDKVGVILERIGIHFPSDILKGKSMQLFGRDLE
jgi:iron only hydrogenase large subunit-like protein